MVIANLATTFERQDLLRPVIDTIIRQVDRVNIWLNSYPTVPLWILGEEKVTWYIDAQNSQACRGKFAFLDGYKGYYFTIDDDIIYPQDYVVKMIEAVERYDRKAIVCVHADNVKQPFKNYYDPNSRDCFLFRSAMREDTVIDFPGTGTMAFHTDTIKFSMHDFQWPFMSDIWMGIIARRNNVPVIAVKRQANWLQAIFTKGIFEKVMKDPELREQQTKLINEYLAMEAA